MGKKKQETGLITRDSFTQDNIPALLEKVTQSIEQIKGVKSEEESVSGKELPGFGAIANLDKTTDLIQAYSSVSGREAAYQAAAKEMGITKVPEFKIDGVSGDKWKKAIIRRELVATSKAKLDKLEKMKKLLVDRMSEEDKMKNAFDEFIDLL